MEISTTEYRRLKCIETVSERIVKENEELKEKNNKLYRTLDHLRENKKRKDKKIQILEEGDVSRFDVWNNLLTKLEKENVELRKQLKNLDLHWHTPEEIPINEEGKPYTVNVLNNLHQIVYYSFSEGCWIDDTSCCDADEFQAWCYLPEYKG